MAGRCERLGIEFRKRPRLARIRPWASTPHLRVGLEAAEPLVDIGDEARLAELAVVDNVDAELDLLAHDLAHRAAQPCGMHRVVDGLALLPGVHGLEHIGWPRQAADMGGENSLAASLHSCSRSLLPDAHSS